MILALFPGQVYLTIMVVCIVGSWILEKALDARLRYWERRKAEAEAERDRLDEAGL